MGDEPRRGAREGGSDERTDEATESSSPSPAATRGGAWLTYHYRLAGPDTPAATGTIKAPSFLTAARRVLARGLGATVGPTPAYLRLRAAGELEVLFRVSQTGGRGADALRVEVEPAGSRTVAGLADPPATAEDEPPASERARGESRPTPHD